MHRITSVVVLFEFSFSFFVLVHLGGWTEKKLSTTFGNDFSITLK